MWLHKTHFQLIKLTFKGWQIFPVAYIVQSSQRCKADCLHQEDWLSSHLHGDSESHDCRRRKVRTERQDRQQSRAACRDRLRESFRLPASQMCRRSGRGGTAYLSPMIDIHRCINCTAQNAKQVTRRGQLWTVTGLEIPTVQYLLNSSRVLDFMKPEVSLRAQSSSTWTSWCSLQPHNQFL